MVKENQLMRRTASTLRMNDHGGDGLDDPLLRSEPAAAPAATTPAEPAASAAHPDADLTRLNRCLLSSFPRCCSYPCPCVFKLSHRIRTLAHRLL
jgi:hypothetical protein